MRCPKLTTLILRHCPNVTYVLEKDRPHDYLEQNLPIHPGIGYKSGQKQTNCSVQLNFSLTRLDLGSCPINHLSGATFSLLPALRHIDLAYVKLLPDHLIEMATCCTHLETINLASSELNNPTLAALAKLPRLTELCVKHCPRISDEGLKNFLSFPSRLNSIDLSRSKSVTTRMLMQLLQHTSQSLTELNLRDCQKVAFSRVLAHVVSGALPHLRVLVIHNCGAELPEEKEMGRNQTHTFFSLYQTLAPMKVLPLPALTSIDIGASMINVRVLHSLLPLDHNITYPLWVDRPTAWANLSNAFLI